MPVRRKGKRITRSSDRGEPIAAKNFHRDTPGKFREIEFHRLSKPGQIRDHENGFALGATEKYQYFRIFREQKYKRPAGAGLLIVSHSNDPRHALPQRLEFLLLIVEVE